MVSLFPLSTRCSFSPEMASSSRSTRFPGKIKRFEIVVFLEIERRKWRLLCWIGVLMGINGSACQLNEFVRSSSLRYNTINLALALTLFVSFWFDLVLSVQGSGHVSARGTIYLSNVRMVFVADKPVGSFFAFDMPLVGIMIFNSFHMLIMPPLVGIMIQFISIPVSHYVCSSMFIMRSLTSLYSTATTFQAMLSRLVFAS